VLTLTTQKNPVTPSEALPAGELLGDMLVEMGMYQEAVRAYESTLERSPNRRNSLFGAGRAAELAGDDEVARRYYGQLVSAAVPGSEHEQLGHARRVLAEN
jgi:tetratricopeptide (TPR) repeat protein